MSAPVRIESLIPQPLPDLRRVSIALSVSGLPAYGPAASSNLAHFPDMPGPGTGLQEQEPNPSPPAPNVELVLDTPPSNRAPAEAPPAAGDDRTSSPYPDVTLSILDQSGNEIATTYIVEHKEPKLDFTLHLREAEPGAIYAACAVMTMNDEIIQSVQVPFELAEKT